MILTLDYTSKGFLIIKKDEVSTVFTRYPEFYSRAERVETALHDCLEHNLYPSDPLLDEIAALGVSFFTGKLNYQSSIFNMRWLLKKDMPKPKYVPLKITDFSLYDIWFDSIGKLKEVNSDIDLLNTIFMAFEKGYLFAEKTNKSLYPYTLKYVEYLLKQKLLNIVDPGMYQVNIDYKKVEINVLPS